MVTTNTISNGMACPKTKIAYDILFPGPHTYHFYHILSGKPNPATIDETKLLLAPCGFSAGGRREKVILLK